MCILTGKISTLTGTPAPRAPVFIRRDDVDGRAPFVGGAALTRDEIVVHTDDTGSFSVTLARGAPVVIRIPDLGLHFQTRIPDAASVTLEELVDASL